MRLPPCVDVGFDLVVETIVLWHQSAPCPDRAAKTASKVSTFADLPLGRGDLGEGIVLAQHLARDHAVWLQLLVAGSVELTVGREFPRLAGEARQDAGFD